MPTIEEVKAVLKKIEDPEIRFSILDLGLIYGIELKKKEVDIKMTFTTPACPYGPALLAKVKTELEQIEGIEKANVELVLEPLWSIEKASREIRDTFELL